MADNKRVVTNVNSFTLNGNLVRDSELTTTASGFKILNFSIANNFAQKSGDNWEQKVNYFDCKVLGSRAEALSNILKKGASVSLLGSIRQERWQTQDGKTASKVVFQCETVEVTRWAQNQQNNNVDQEQRDFAQNQAYNGSGDFPEDIPGGEDIPF